MDKKSRRDLARRLLAASQTASGPHGHEAVVMSGKAGDFPGKIRRRRRLRIAPAAGLGAGQRGRVFAAKRQDRRGRSLEGLNSSPLTRTLTRWGVRAAVAITAHLLGLLVAFIGENLTLRLLRETGPNFTAGEYDIAGRTE